MDFFRCFECNEELSTHCNKKALAQTLDFLQKHSVKATTGEAWVSLSIPKYWCLQVSKIYVEWSRNDLLWWYLGWYSYTFKLPSLFIFVSDCVIESCLRLFSPWMPLMCVMRDQNHTLNFKSDFFFYLLECTSCSSPSPPSGLIIQNVGLDCTFYSLFRITSLLQVPIHFGGFEKNLLLQLYSIVEWLRQSCTEPNSIVILYLSGWH